MSAIPTRLWAREIETWESTSDKREAARLILSDWRFGSFRLRPECEVVADGRNLSTRDPDPIYRYYWRRRSRWSDPCHWLPDEFFVGAARQYGYPSEAEAYAWAAEQFARLVEAHGLGHVLGMLATLEVTRAE